MGYAASPEAVDSSYDPSNSGTGYLNRTPPKQSTSSDEPTYPAHEFFPRPYSSFKHAEEPTYPAHEFFIRPYNPSNNQEETSNTSSGGNSTSYTSNYTGTTSTSTSAKTSSSTKKSGVNKKIARKVHTLVEKDLANLEKHMNNLVEHIEKMNELYWYGDTLANNWYNQISKHYSKNKKLNLIRFYRGVDNYQKSLKNVFKKSSINKINF